MHTAAYAAIGALAVALALIAAWRLRPRSDAFAAVLAFEQARRALGRDVAAGSGVRPAVELQRRTA